MTTASWYAVIAGEEMGPFTEPELRVLAERGAIVRATKVRAPDMPEPIAARELPGLFPPLVPAGMPGFQTLLGAPATRHKVRFDRWWLPLSNGLGMHGFGVLRIDALGLNIDGLAGTLWTPVATTLRFEAQEVAEFTRDGKTLRFHIRSPRDGWTDRLIEVYARSPDDATDLALAVEKWPKAPAVNEFAADALDAPASKDEDSITAADRASFTEAGEATTSAFAEPTPEPSIAEPAQAPSSASDAAPITEFTGSAADATIVDPPPATGDALVLQAPIATLTVAEPPTADASVAIVEPAPDAAMAAIDPTESRTDSADTFAAGQSIAPASNANPDPASHANVAETAEGAEEGAPTLGAPVSTASAVDHSSSTSTATDTEEVDQHNRFIDSLFRNTPRLWVTPALVATCVIVFLVTAFLGAGWFSPDASVHARFGSNLATRTAAGQPWRLITNVFLHFGVIHLALNMWALASAGPIAERIYGNARFLFIFLISGVAGSIASVAWNWNVNSAGASGAIFGIIGALAVFLFDGRNGMPMTLRREQQAAVGIFIAYSLIVGLVGSNIDNAAHLGGLLAGGVTGLLLSRPIDPNERAVRRKGQIALVSLLLPAVLVALALPVLHRAGSHHQETLFERGVAALVSEERALDESMQGIIDALRSNKYSVPHVRQALDTQAVAWGALNAQFAGARIDARSRYANLHRQLVTYTSLRARAAQSLAASLRLHDEIKAREGAALLASARALEPAFREQIHPR